MPACGPGDSSSASESTTCRTRRTGAGPRGRPRPGTTPLGLGGVGASATTTDRERGPCYYACAGPDIGRLEARSGASSCAIPRLECPRMWLPAPIAAATGSHAQLPTFLFREGEGGGHGLFPEGGGISARFSAAWRRLAMKLSTSTSLLRVADPSLMNGPAMCLQRGERSK